MDLKGRFVFLYVLLGFALAVPYFLVFATWNHVPSRVATKADAAQVAQAAVRKAVGSQDVVAACERATESSISNAGGTVTSMKRQSVAAQKDGTVRVDINIVSDIYTGVGHCVLAKGIFQVTEVGPQA